MAKGSRRLVVLGFLLLFFLYATFLRCNFTPTRLWKYPVLHWGAGLSIRSSNGAGTEEIDYRSFMLRRLVRGKARRRLRRSGVACISDPNSDIWITTRPIRLRTGSSSPATIYVAAGQRLPLAATRFLLRPYPRKTDGIAMNRTSPVVLLSSSDALPPCDATHSSPAVIFSTGGFAGNFFHDFNDVLIPLFLTSGHLRPKPHLVVTDYEPWWARKYRHVLDRLSASNCIVASSSSMETDGQVHCFPAAVVGLKYHGNLACNATDAPGGVTINDFRDFLKHSFKLNSTVPAGDDRPVLVLLSRRKSRMLLNEADVVEMAENVGFRVTVATAEAMSKLEAFAEVVSTCDVLMGVHGAGLTNMVFMRAGTVVVQVVPWGLDWAATEYYGRPVKEMGLEYVEYKTEVEESTLYDEYPKDHPVLVDPWGVNLKGYDVSRPLYTDGQNVRLNLTRFRETLLQAMRLVIRP